MVGEILSPGLEIVPIELREHIEDRLNHYLEPMESPYGLEKIDLFPE